MDAEKNLLLTGDSGVGKTTLLFRALRRTGLEYGGFVVKRRYVRGRRLAMEMVDLSTGARAEIALFGESRKPTPVPSTFGAVGVPAIASALDEKQFVVMDELGRFELASPEFIREVGRALDSRVPVVGVIKRESNSFLDSVRARADVKVVYVSRENRDEVYSLLVRFLSRIG